MQTHGYGKVSYKEFLVVWKGKPLDEATWERAESLWWFEDKFLEFLQRDSTQQEWTSCSLWCGEALVQNGSWAPTLRALLELVGGELQATCVFVELDLWSEYLATKSVAQSEISWAHDASSSIMVHVSDSNTTLWWAHLHNSLLVSSASTCCDHGQSKWCSSSLTCRWLS